MSVKKKILYIDMDNVLVDYPSGLMSEEQKIKFKDQIFDEKPVIFSQMKPLEGAIEAFQELSKIFDSYILSTAPWNNKFAWGDKLEWVKTYLGKNAEKRLILTHNKHLNMGDFLIDDRKANGAKDFTGEHIFFGHDPRFMNWTDVVNYLKRRS